MFSDSNINKTLSTFILLSSVISMVVLAALRVPVPDTLNGIIGIAIGYASTSLGVGHGATISEVATNNANVATNVTNGQGELKNGQKGN